MCCHYCLWHSHHALWKMPQKSNPWKYLSRTWQCWSFSAPSSTTTMCPLELLPRLWCQAILHWLWVYKMSLLVWCNAHLLSDDQRQPFEFLWAKWLWGTISRVDSSKNSKPLMNAAEQLWKCLVYNPFCLVDCATFIMMLINHFHIILNVCQLRPFVRYASNYMVIYRSELPFCMFTYLYVCIYFPIFATYIHH